MKWVFVILMILSYATLAMFHPKIASVVGAFGFGWFVKDFADALFD